MSRKLAFALTATLAISAMLVPVALGSVIKVAVAEDFDATW